MTEPKLILRLHDIPKSEALELQERLGSEHVKIEEPPLGGDTHGDLGTVTAVVVVALAAMKIIPIIFTRERKTRRIRMVIEQETAQGRLTRSEVELEEESSKPLTDSAIRQLGKLFSDPDAVEGQHQ